MQLGEQSDDLGTYVVILFGVKSGHVYTFFLFFDRSQILVGRQTRLLWSGMYLFLADVQSYSVAESAKARVGNIRGVFYRESWL